MSVSTGTLLNPGEYGQKVESVRILKTFRTITKKCRINVSTGKLLSPGENQEKVESLRVPKKCPDEYRKIVESV